MYERTAVGVDRITEMESDCKYTQGREVHHQRESIQSTNKTLNLLNYLPADAGVTNMKHIDRR